MTIDLYICSRIHALKQNVLRYTLIELFYLGPEAICGRCNDVDLISARTYRKNLVI